MGWVSGRGPHRILETSKARIVPVVDLTLVVDHCEELVVVQRLWAWIAARAWSHGTGRGGGGWP